MIKLLNTTVVGIAVLGSGYLMTGVSTMLFVQAIGDTLDTLLALQSTTHNIADISLQELSE